MTYITNKDEFIEIARKRGYSEDEINEGLNTFVYFKKEGLNVTLDIVLPLPPRSEMFPDPPFTCE